MRLRAQVLHRLLTVPLVDCQATPSSTSLLLGVTMDQDEQRLVGGVRALDDASETRHFVGTGETWPPLAPCPAVIVEL
jgi:hypothetical protein